MNDMIFDLIENCENILDGKGYVSTKAANFEQSVFIKYLLNKGFSEKNVKAIWLESRADKFNGVEQSVIDASFKKLLHNSKDIKLVEHDPIKIYDLEIQFINNLNIYKWEKQYFFVLMCVYKYYNREWVEINDRIRRFCFSVTDTKNERERHAVAIAQDRVKYKIYDINTRTGKNDRTTVSIKFTMESLNKGDIIAEISNPRHIDESILDLITCKHVCNNCGAVYNYTPKGIDNFLCPKCYKKERNKLANLYHKQQT